MTSLADRLAALSPAQRALLKQRLQQAPAAGGSTRIPRRPRGDGIYPLSSAQERMWFNHQWEPDSPLYTEGIVVQIDGALDAGTLQHALDAVVQRHDILRTVIGERDGKQVQIVAATLPVPITVLDWRHLSAGALEAEVRRLLAAEADWLFDLTKGPLLRLTLVRETDARHKLVFIVHHIIFDGWSAGVFFQELFDFYSAEAAQQPAGLPDVPVQYADYAVWQRERLDGSVLAGELAYWRRQLADLPPALDLPTDRPRLPVRSAAGARHFFTVDPAMTQGVRDLCQRYDVTPFMALLALFAVLLYRYTGQDRIAVGAPNTNRSRSELEGMIGLFVNTFVLAVDLSGEPAFAEVLARVRSVTLGAQSHKELPFERLIEELRPARDLSRTPLFEVMFDFQKLPTPLEPPGLQATLLAIDSSTAKFDLGLSIRDAGTELRGELEYSVALFEPSTITRMVGHYLTLLAAVVRDAEMPIWRLPLLGDAETRQVLVDWNATSAPVPDGKSLVDLFEEQAARTPDQAAVIFAPGRSSTGHATESDALTFAQLDARANQIAHLLHSMGVGRGARVAICMGRAPAMIAGVLGILKAGAAYVPLDPEYPPDRLGFMLADSGAQVILASDPLEGVPPGIAAIDLVGEWSIVAGHPAQSPGHLARPGDLAYVIYTSGSTGRPKGVMVEHRSVVNLMYALEAAVPAYRAGTAHYVAVNGPLAFDTSVKQVVQLLRGRTLEIIPAEIRFDGETMLSHLRASPIDVLDCTPSQLELLIAAGLLKELDGGGKQLTLLIGGEAIAQGMWRRLAASRTVEAVNVYGPTEATVDATAAVIAEAPKNAVIGRPLANVQTYVLDDYGQPVPIGVPGELYIGGAGVARGYHNQPEMTRERFVAPPAPLIAQGAAHAGFQPSARLYRTGDRVRLRPDGALEYLGRMDSQVKLRGHRVELGEIEAVLRQHPDVTQAVAVVREEAGGHRRLVAYVECKPGRAPAVGDRQRRVLPNGLAVVELNRNETDFLYEEMFEVEAYYKHGVGVQPGDIVFDVGANIGLFSLSASLQGAASIYAFEPNPVVNAVLQQNLRLYGVPATVLPYGLGSHSGRASFVHYPAFTSLSGLYADPEADKAVVHSYIRRHTTLAPGTNGAAGEAQVLDELLADKFEQETIEIEVRSLSQAMYELGVERIDLLKINVEKSELDVLQGIAAADWGRIRQVALELHDIDGRLATVVDLLGAQGYTVAVEQDWQLEESARSNYYVYATRGSRPPATGHAPRRLPASPFLTDGDLRDFLRTRLPDVMVPATILLLEQMPLTANGKIDPARLAALDATLLSASHDYAAPAGPVESRLAEIWAGVLGLPQVGRHDNFFDLGGDSILSLQIVTRARQAGITLTTRQLFTHKTVAALAAALAKAEPEDKVSAAEVTAVDQSGPLPLTPIQQRFFAANMPAAHWFNQSMTVDLAAGTAPVLVARAVAAAFSHHDALRLRFRQGGSGWEQEVAPAERGQSPLREIDLSTLPAAEREECWQEQCRAAEQSLDLARGPLWAGVLAHGARGGPRLFLTAHHLVVDMVSWRVLVEDMATAYDRLARGEAVALHTATTPFATFARALDAYANSVGLRAEGAYWTDVRRTQTAPLPRDVPDGDNTTASQQAVATQLDAATTRVLLVDLPKRLQVQANDVLLTVLAQTLATWSGQRSVLIDVEGHGREAPFDGVDLTHSVGWFTTIYPLLLRVEEGGDPQAALRSVREQVRAVPAGGYNYGVLRSMHAAGEVAASLAALPQPEVSFNYLGQFGGEQQREARFALNLAAGDLSSSPANERPALIEVIALVIDGSLHMEWRYSAQIHRRETVARWAEEALSNLRALIASSEPAHGYSTADFPQARLNQAQLDQVLALIAGEGDEEPARDDE